MENPPGPNEQEIGTWKDTIRRMGQQHSVHRIPRSAHNLRNLMTLGALLTGFTLTLLTIEQSFDSLPLRFALEAIAFGLLYFVLHVLVVHEASHNMFLLTRKNTSTRTLNRVCGWLVCGCFGVHYDQLWREGHRAHHRNPVVQNDPQNCPAATLTGRALLRQVVPLLLLPLLSLKSVKSCLDGGSGRSRNPVLTTGVQVLLLGLLLAVTWNNLVMFAAALWGFGVAQALNLVKISMEHGGSTGREPDVLFRSRSSTFFLRHLLMPLNISLHFEHHFCATVPWYRLGAFHRQVLAVTPSHIRSRILNDGWPATLSRISGAGKG